MSLLEIDNNLYGVTLYGGNADRGTAFKLSFDGSLTSLASFEGLTVGSIPTSLILSRESVAYGTTAVGGNKNSGTIFKRVGSDVITLHSFSGGADGAKPSALVQATDGNFYGTTSIGNASSQAGTILRSIPRAISRRSLPGLRTQVVGQTPSALVQGSDGNFYGTTRFGSPAGTGTIFKYTSAGVLSILRSFDATTDGAFARRWSRTRERWKLLRTDSFWWQPFVGTVFRISSSGTMATLFNFADPPGPEFNFIQAADGNLYTALGGDGENTYGRILKVTPPNNVSLLYDDPYHPSFVYSNAPLLQTYDGFFYVMTQDIYGDVYRLPGSQVVYPFDPADAHPVSSMIEEADGNLLGAAVWGHE